MGRGHLHEEEEHHLLESFHERLVEHCQVGAWKERQPVPLQVDSRVQAAAAESSVDLRRGQSPEGDGGKERTKAVAGNCQRDQQADPHFQETGQAVQRAMDQLPVSVY